jgi:hypothetical protein
MAPVNCINKNQLFRFVGQQAFGSVIALNAVTRYPNDCHGYYAQRQTENVRSAVPMSSHRNGLSISRIAVFATCFLAKPPVTNLRIRSTYLPLSSVGFRRRLSRPLD